MRKIEINQERLRFLYEDLAWSQQKTANYFGISHGTVSLKMRDYGIEARDKCITSRRYAINQDFFEDWHKESAWLYGWFLGDGYFTQPYGFGFRLQEKDRQILDKFKEVLKSEHPMYDYGVAQIHFHSKKLTGNLQCLSYMSIPSIHLPDFVRGFFEAEGCVSQKDGGILIQVVQKKREILEFIQTSLASQTLIRGGGLFHVQSWNGWNLQFRTHDSLSIYHYLYDNCGDLYLPRKKQKFEELIGNVTAKYRAVLDGGTLA